MALPPKKKVGPSVAILASVATWEREIDGAIKATAPGVDVVVGRLRMPLSPPAWTILAEKYQKIGWGREVWFEGSRVSCVMEDDHSKGLVLLHPDGEGK